MGMDWQLDGLNRPPPGVDDVWHLATNGKTLVQPNRCNSTKRHRNIPTGTP